MAGEETTWEGAAVAQRILDAARELTAVFAERALSRQYQESFKTAWGASREVAGVIYTVINMLEASPPDETLSHLRADATDQVRLLWHRLAQFQIFFRKLDLIALEILDPTLARTAANICAALERGDVAPAYYHDGVLNNVAQPATWRHLVDTCRGYWNNSEDTTKIESVMLGSERTQQRKRLESVCGLLSTAHATLTDHATRREIRWP